MTHQRPEIVSDLPMHNSKRYEAANMLTNLGVVAMTGLISLWLTAYLIGELSI